MYDAQIMPESPVLFPDINMEAAPPAKDSVMHCLLRNNEVATNFKKTVDLNTGRDILVLPDGEQADKYDLVKHLTSDTFYSFWYIHVPISWLNDCVNKSKEYACEHLVEELIKKNLQLFYLNEDVIRYMRKSTWGYPLENWMHNLDDLIKHLKVIREFEKRQSNPFWHAVVDMCNNVSDAIAGIYRGEIEPAFYRDPTIYYQESFHYGLPFKCFARVTLQ